MRRSFLTDRAIPARITIVLFGVLLLAAACARLSAGTAAPGATGKGTKKQAVVRAFELRYRHASTLKAIFYERYSDGKGTGQAESGAVYFSRPGRMRWEYESPQKKLFIVDGTNVWFYIPDDHTASRTKLRQSSDWRTPIALLADKADLSRICRSIDLVPARTAGPGESTAAAQTNSADSVLRCTPRAGSDETGQPISDVLLTIDPHGYLVRVLIQQPGSISTEFRFGNWQENLRIAEVMFHFQPPPGVEIVDEEKLAGQTF